MSRLQTILADVREIGELTTALQTALEEIDDMLRLEAADGIVFGPTFSDRAEEALWTLTAAAAGKLREALEIVGPLAVRAVAIVDDPMR